MSGSNLSLPTVPQTPRTDEPLSLTVHSVGVPDDAQGARTRVGRWKMLAVLAICAAPVIASYFTYYVVRPEGRRNYGELIDPQRPIPALQVQTLEAQSTPLASIKGNWLLISVAGAACDSACERHLYLQRQLREGLGKEKDRLDWVWLVNDTAPVRPQLLAALQAAKVLRVPQGDLNAWLGQGTSSPLAAHLYVVDPLGNWMMRFPANVDPVRAKRDLERLMRGSSFWHKRAR